MTQLAPARGTRRRRFPSLAMTTSPIAARFKNAQSAEKGRAPSRVEGAAPSLFLVRGGLVLELLDRGSELF